jgi:hypothetical protein
MDRRKFVAGAAAAALATPTMVASARALAPRPEFYDVYCNDVDSLVSELHLSRDLAESWWYTWRYVLKAHRAHLAIEALENRAPPIPMRVIGSLLIHGHRAEKYADVYVDSAAVESPRVKGKPVPGPFRVVGDRVFWVTKNRCPDSGADPLEGRLDPVKAGYHNVFIPGKISLTRRPT